MAVDLTSKQQNFVSRTISASDALLEAANELQSLKREFQELDYASSMDATTFVGDIVHVDLPALAALATTVDAVTALMDSGHRATLLRMRR